MRLLPVFLRAPLRALALAGLCLLGAIAVAGAELSPTAEEAAVSPSAAVAAPAVVPVRSVAKGPSQEARMAELRTAIKGLQADLETQRAAMASLEESLKARDQAVDGSLRELRQGQEGQDQALQELKAVSDKQVGDLNGLADSLDATLKRNSAALKQMDDFVADFKDKRERLEGIADLLGALRKDLNDNSQEIVELKRSVKPPAPETTAGPSPSPSFLEQMTGWPYLSATALAVAIAALFVAIR
jgi:Rad3-related DNA helicase